MFSLIPLVDHESVSTKSHRLLRRILMGNKLHVLSSVSALLEGEGSVYLSKLRLGVAIWRVWLTAGTCLCMLS